MSKEAIEFYHWMMKNDTPENADKYFHWSDDDMYNEFLKQKNSTKENDIPHSEIRRMESEGVYEEKFDKSNSSNDTTIYFQDEWNKSPLHHDIDGYEDKEHSLNLVDNFYDESPKDIQDFEIDNKDVEQLVFDEMHALDMVLNDIVKDMDDDYEESNDSNTNDTFDVSIDRHEPFENDDESSYVDGVDERPIKKKKEYNDDEFDY